MLIKKSTSNYLNLNHRNGHLTVWQCSLGLDQMYTVESINNKKLKVNDNDDGEEDDIDLSKGEDRERYVMSKEGI